MNTSLTRYAAAMRDPDPDGQRTIAGKLWRDMGIAVIFVDDLRGLDRELVAAMANRIYGRRVNG